MITREQYDSGVANTEGFAIEIRREHATRRKLGKIEIALRWHISEICPYTKGDVVHMMLDLVGEMEVVPENVRTLISHYKTVAPRQATPVIAGDVTLNDILVVACAKTMKPALVDMLHVVFGFYFGPMPRDSLAIRYFSNYVNRELTPIITANKNFNFEIETHKRIEHGEYEKKYPKSLTEQYGIYGIDHNDESAHLAAAFLNERLAEVGDGSIDFTIAHKDDMLRMCAAEIMTKHDIQYDVEKWGVVDLEKIHNSNGAAHSRSPWVGRLACQMRRDKVAARLANE
jgi:hypothetical protein